MTANTIVAKQAAHAASSGLKPGKAREIPAAAAQTHQSPASAAQPAGGQRRDRSAGQIVLVLQAAARSALIRPGSIRGCATAESSPIG
jgi:hypothetical protein